MSKKERFLITTADERTWKFDRPVIFLGEWCRLYDRKHIWQNMDAIVAPPYGLGGARKDADHVEARALEDKLFPALCEVLNKHHGAQHSERFWRIVLGHWLRRYVDVMINRVKTLEQCLQKNKISGVTTYANDFYTLATQDSYSAIWAFNDNRWNSALDGRILELLLVESCSVEHIADDESISFSFKVLADTLTLKRTIVKWGYHQLRKLLSFFVSDSDAFIINSYMPKKVEIKLQLALGQCPQLWTSPKLDVVEKPSRLLRARLTERFSNLVDDKFENILNVMLFELLPACYLEGFAYLNKLVNQQPWPKSPKFIFTSNNFDADEVFKLWAANKVERGAKYFIGQHGNNYGTYRYMYPAIEEVTADKFLTWGWTDGLAQHTEAFIFKTADKRAEHYNPEGGLLLIEDMLHRRYSTWDTHADFANNFEDQISFVLKLNYSLRKHLTIRLHALCRYMKWGEKIRWREIDPLLKLNEGGTPIRALVSQSRLVVHGYDSTGMLETLSQNIPTLSFWHNNFEHLRECSKPYYQLLKDAGIVHLTPESAARKVNEVWDDVDGWWQQDIVQDARKEFCKQYARQSQNPVRDLKKIFMSKNVLEIR